MGVDTRVDVQIHLLPLGEAKHLRQFEPVLSVLGDVEHHGEPRLVAQRQQIIDVVEEEIAAEATPNLAVQLGIHRIH